MLTHELPPRDDRSDNFRHLAGMIVAVAKHYDISVDTTTEQRWNDCLGLLREFDTLVDDYDIPHQQALAALRDFTPFAANYPSMRPEAVGGATHQIMVNRVGRILQLGRTISSTTNTEEFITARCEEVEQTAYLLADCAHGDTTTQPGFYTQFMPTLCSMGRAANTVDSLVDMRQDIHQEKITIRPSAQLLAGLGRVALGEMAPTAMSGAILLLWGWPVCATGYAMVISRIQACIICADLKPYYRSPLYDRLIT